MSDMDVTARFRADISDLQKKMKTVESSLKNVQGQTDKSSKGFTVLKGAMGTALGGAAIAGIYKGVAAIKSFAMGSIDAAVEARKADQRIQAIALSMGVLNTNLGGSTKRITDFATKLQSTTGVSDETIKQGQALLLTFKDVASSAGEAGGFFDRATAAALDLSAAGFGSVEGEAKKLGKALQDPIKGISALGKSGVTFTKQEQEKIKVLVESGKTLQAQEMIMRAVEMQSGGTAAALMTSGDKMRVAFDEFQEKLGAAVLPLVERFQMFITDRVVPALQSFADKAVLVLNALVPMLPTLTGITVAALAAYGAFKLYSVIPAILKAVNIGIKSVQANMKALNLIMSANPLIAPIAAVVAALAVMAIAFKMVYDRSKPLRDAVSALVETFKSIASVIMNDLIGAFTSGGNEAGKLGKTGESIGDVFNKVAQIIGDYLVPVIQGIGMYFKILGNGIRVLIKWWEILFTVAKMIAGLLKAVVIVAFTKVSYVIGTVLDKLGPVGAAFKKVGASISSAFSNIGGVVKGAMAGATSFIEKAINIAIDAINFLIDAYNKIPFISDVGRIEPFVITAFQEAAGYDAAAANAAAAARYQGMADTGKGYIKPGKAAIGGGAGGGKGGAEKENKALEAIKEKYNKLRETLKGASDAYQSIASQTESRFGEPSQIIKAFGMEGDVGSVISQYDQLDAALREYYANLAKSPGLSKKAIKEINAAGTAQRAELEAIATRSVALMRERNRIQKELSTLDETYSASQERIGASYDDLDKAAEASLKSITEKWDKAIPALESALASATEAFDKENSVLQDLISKRDSFLASIKSGINSFVNAFSFEGADAAGIKAQLEARLKSVREFTANIRTLVERGLDPALVQEFVAAGVSGAGEAVAALAAGSAGDIAGINAVQSSLASEIAGFQEYASQQWFDAGIAQQEAIVGPLAAAKDQAAAALATANATRAAEIASAQDHIDALKVQRQNALDQAKADYLVQKTALIAQGDAIEAELTTNAEMVQSKFTSLQETMPPEMMEIGKKAINGIIKGINSRETALINRAREIGEAVKSALEKALDINSPSKVTTKIGEQVAQGLANGMGAGEDMVSRGATNLGISAIPSMSGGGGGSVVVNNRYEVNIQSLSTDKRQIGREVVEAIKAFEKSSGPVYQPASI